GSAETGLRITPARLGRWPATSTPGRHGQSAGDEETSPGAGHGHSPRRQESATYFFAAQGFFAAHGFFVAQGFCLASPFFIIFFAGFWAAQGFFAAHGFLDR